MNANDAPASQRLRWLSFSVRDLLWLCLLIAVVCAWMFGKKRDPAEIYDVQGPIWISSSVKNFDGTMTESNIAGVNGINFRGDNIIVFTGGNGKVFPSKNLLKFEWHQE